jgi:KDO2-lipid IV(A) lauroyltransferase
MQRKKKFNPYHPKWWPTWVIVGFLYLLTKLPFKLSLAVGVFIGRVMYRFQHYLRHIAEVNINTCFHKLTNEQKKNLIKRNFESLGMGFIETVFSLWGNEKKMIRRFTFEGTEHLESALKKGNGALILFAHFAPLELTAHIYSKAQLPLDDLYIPLKNPVINKLIIKARNKNLDQLIVHNDVRALVRRLKENAAILYGSDQDFGSKRSIFVPFFGEEAATIKSIRRIVKLTNTSVVPVFYGRTQTGKYIIRMEQALENFPGEDEYTDLKIINCIYERMIMERPEQYFWFHFRFKTRPNGSKPLYDTEKFKRLGY